MVDFSDFLHQLLTALLEQLNAGDVRTGKGSGGGGPPVQFDGLKIPFVLAELLDGKSPGEILLDAMGGEAIVAFPDQDQAAAGDHEVPGAELHGFLAALEDPTAGFNDVHGARVEVAIHMGERLGAGFARHGEEVMLDLLECRVPTEAGDIGEGFAIPAFGFERKSK